MLEETKQKLRGKAPILRTFKTQPIQKLQNTECIIYLNSLTRAAQDKHNEVGNKEKQEKQG